MTEIVSLAAILACTLFAGAAIYINLVEHPARLSCGTEIAAKQWAPSYKRATVMQASLAMIAAAAGATRWVQSRDTFWLWGAVTIAAVVPVTLFVIFPTKDVFVYVLAALPGLVAFLAWRTLLASALVSLAPLYFVIGDLTRSRRRMCPKSPWTGRCRCNPPGCSSTARSRCSS